MYLPRRVGRYYGLVTVPPPPRPPPPPQIIYVRTSAGQSFSDFGLQFCRCIDIGSMILNIDFRKNRKNTMATRGRFSEKKICQTFFVKIHFSSFRTKKFFFQKKNFRQKNLENFPKFLFFVYWNFFCMSALKLFRRENKSIQMNPTNY